MGLQSLDSVNVGDWLVCESGPKILVRHPFSEELETRRDREMEGILVQVVAVNPPLFLVDIYDFGRKGKITAALNFNDAVWTKANETYKEKYLANCKAKTKEMRGEQDTAV